MSGPSSTIESARSLWASKNGLWVFALIALITIFWIVFIVKASAVSNYSSGMQVRFFQNASFWDVLTIMNDGKYLRFSPLAFGPIGYFDTHILVPLLGLSNEKPDALAHATRLVWLHPILSAANCIVAATITWRIFRDMRLVVLAVLLVGLTDTVAFEFRFVALLGFYGLQMCAMWALFSLARIGYGDNSKQIIFLCLSVAIALGIWEQGLDLALPVIVALATLIFLKREEAAHLYTKTEFKALIIIGTLTLLYVGMHLRAGLSEALTRNREDSFFFTYHNLMPMVDDVLLNIGALFMQAFRQFLPIPPLSLAVLGDVNMNTLNTYNLGYAQYPNMFYRMMGMWYGGVSFACGIALVLYSIKLARRAQAEEKRLIIGAIYLFVLGFAMHLPIMHRDYYYIPGYAVGYKIAISFMGFVVLLLFAVREFLRSRFFTSLGDNAKIYVCSAAALYYCAAAVSRIVLGQLPHVFPW